ncbi:MAG: hydrogenase expression/formation protein HypE [Hyphomonadaceae bacterium]|nr:hydrogenase expression/formation protein HypE [Clostridia bacterium]
MNVHIEDKIIMAHGSGGISTKLLVDEVFAKVFHNETLARMDDAAVVTVDSKKLAFTTDSFVVKPIFFQGGNIGKLAVCGTVNDLLMMGATPKYMTVGFVLMEGLPIASLQEVVNAMQLEATAAGIQIVAGDTKVIEGDGGIIINCSAIGTIEDETIIGAAHAKPDDVVILSGTLGEHHATILCARMGIQNDIHSDCASLTEMVQGLLQNNIDVHVMRDVTRGGLSTILNEIATASHVTIEITEDDIPMNADVKAFSDILGLDPFTMGNEGKMVCIVSQSDAPKALDIIKNSAFGENAAIIGRVSDINIPKVLLKTRFGASRSLEILFGEGLPRIC